MIVGTVGPTFLGQVGTGGTSPSWVKAARLSLDLGLGLVAFSLIF
jgi:hypothetical protein